MAHGDASQTIYIYAPNARRKTRTKKNKNFEILQMYICINFNAVNNWLIVAVFLFEIRKSHVWIYLRYIEEMTCFLLNMNNEQDL